MYNFTFPTGATCASPDASIPIIDDTISENDETFSITIMEVYLPYGIKLGSTKRATVFIEDNDSKYTAKIKFVSDNDQILCVFVFYPTILLLHLQL